MCKAMRSFSACEQAWKGVCVLANGHKTLGFLRARARGKAIAAKMRDGRRNGRVAELNHDEARLLFDRAVRSELNMSAAEFLRRLDADKLPDTPVVEQLAILAGGARTRK